MLRKAALRQLIHRPMTTLLMILIMGLSLGISLFLSALHEGIHEGLTKATEPFSLLVSSPGSQYQLVLTSVFLQDRPLPNLPYEEVDALSGQKNLVSFALPLAFGDSYGGYRVVGTTGGIFAMTTGKNKDKWLILQQGRPFSAPYEAVIGADVARRLHLTVGSTFSSLHGLVQKGRAHKEHPYTVVGILTDVKGPYNQAILTSIESIWDAHEHKKNKRLEAKKADNKTHNDHKEVSAILVEPVGYSEAYQLAAKYQHRKDAMLVFPSQSIVQLFNLMGCGERMWQKVGLFLIVLSTLIVVMTSYLSSLSRLREYAIMRALGATGKDISHIFLWQNAFLVLCGTAAGNLLGIGAYTLLAHALASTTALSLPLFSFSPVMGILLAATVAATLLLSLIPLKILKEKLASMM